MFLKRVEWWCRCKNGGPATANALSTMVERRVEGTTRSADDTERRRRRAVLATGTASSVKYRGAWERTAWTSHAQALVASEGPSAAVLRGRTCERLLTGEQPRWRPRRVIGSIVTESLLVDFATWLFQITKQSFNKMLWTQNQDLMKHSMLLEAYYWNFF